MNHSFIQPFADRQPQYDIADAGDTARGENADNLWLWQFKDNDDNSDDEIKHDDCIDEGNGGLVSVKALRGLSVKCEVSG